MNDEQQAFPTGLVSEAATFEFHPAISPQEIVKRVAELADAMLDEDAEHAKGGAE